MKKIIIAAAIVCAAVVANAVTCNWSGSAIALNGSAAVTSYAVYLIDPTVTSITDMSAKLKAKDTSALAGAIETTTGIAVGTTAARWNKNNWGTFAAGSSYTYYSVILNNSASAYDAYMITGTVTATAPAAGSLVMGFGSQASNSWNNVPEPTSAMLLLLGVAGLALRRKQK